MLKNIMNLFNYVVIGSGPAGVAAARHLEKDGVCILDAGLTETRSFMHESLREAQGDIPGLLGEHWEMLETLKNPVKRHAKLRAKDFRHIANGEKFEVYDNHGTRLLQAYGSYARGGMSPAWGGQLFRYTQQDLEKMEDWPISAEDLRPFYESLEGHIGFSGTKDDMADFLGPIDELMPPIPLVPAAEYILKKFKKSVGLKIRLGRSRLAVHTREFRGQPPHQFGETDFFTPTDNGLYSASKTLDELLENGNVAYLGGCKLISWDERQDYVELVAQNINSNEEIKIRARHLLLGCGVIHTAKLVLANKSGAGFKLPFLDHPPTLIPFFIPSLFCSPIPEHSFPVQLVATLEDDIRDMISFYYAGGMLWTDLLGDIPLPMRAGSRMIKSILGGMMVAQIWEPSFPSRRNFLELKKDGLIRIEYSERKPYKRMDKLLKQMRALGAWSISRLASMSPPGWGFHYAATLPMRKNPGLFETHVDGRLWDSRRVRVIDGSVLPSLPAKNHSFTVMANAARIADEAKKCGF